MKRWRTAIILSVVVFALGGLATWEEWQTSKDEEAKKNSNRLTLIKPEDVVELSYATLAEQNAEPASAETEATSAKKTKLEAYELLAVKKEGSWGIVKPVDAPADQEAINSLVKTIADYSYVKDLGVGKDKWAEYGLLTPLRTVGLKTRGDKPASITVYVGNKAPVGFSVYFRTDQSDHVFMGSQHLLTSTAKSFFEFRNKTVVSLHEPTLKILDYKRKNQTAIEFVKLSEGYTIVKPQAMEADSAEVKDFIEELNVMRASSIVEPPPASLQAAFLSPDLELSWQLEPSTSGSVASGSMKFVEKDGEFFASSDPKLRVFGLSKDLKAKLSKDLTHFRNRRILDQKLMADVKEIRIDGDVFREVNGEWYTAADADKVNAKAAEKSAEKPEEKPSEQAHIRAFAVDLEFAKTDEFFAPTDTKLKGLDKQAPLHRISLVPKTGETVTLDLFAAPAASDKYLVKISRAPYIYRVAKSSFNSMTPAPVGSKSVPGTSGADPTILPGAGSPNEDEMGDEQLNLGEG